MEKLILLFLLIPALLCAGPIQQKHQAVIAAMNAGGGSLCTTTAVEISQEVNNTSKNINTASSYGQRFLTTGAIELKSIDIYISAEALEAEESALITLRIGPDDDLTTTYLSETTHLYSDSDGLGWVTIVFSTPVSLSAATEYRFAPHWPLTSTDGISIGGAAPSVYASNYLFNSIDGTSWVYNNSTSTDLMFRINKCTN